MHNYRPIQLQRSTNHDTWGKAVLLDIESVNFRVEITLGNMTLQFIYTTFRLHGKGSDCFIAVAAINVAC